MLKTARAALALFAILAAGCDDGNSDAVSGTISMPPAMQAKLGASDTLFIYARPADQTGGPPLAVLKEVGMKFPLKYKIGQEDVLMPGKFFRGKVTIQAVIRKSGLATLVVPGDLRGAATHTVEPGATGVDIMLDQPDAGASSAAR